ncbi:hypothetical protein HO133_001649 [Letharia lupina]|uniref:Uncharacterized protein n=1 Tax=Letharia lupina TaxID=560253 RepID=A0A8H6CEE4_9LECA|nr:uncharacterized protein HO133_001649 [Letharia lupina]KAF6221681.1 hypothetical protein HO133_001649 [Letharia lupina]
MNVGTDNETGTVSSAGVIFDTGPNPHSLSEQPPRPSCRVLAEAGQKPSQPTFEGIPVDIRAMIYNHILNTEADSSLRSASETRAQLSPRRGGPGLPTHTWHEMEPSADGATSQRPARPESRCARTRPSRVRVARDQPGKPQTSSAPTTTTSTTPACEAFPEPRSNLLTNLPRPVPFSDTQLHVMRSLGPDYRNSHHHHRTDAAANDMDNCIARNNIHIREACPSLTTFSLSIFSRPPLTPQSQARARTALALGELGKRPDRLSVVSTLPDSAVAVCARAIAPGADGEGCGVCTVAI